MTLNPDDLSIELKYRGDIPNFIPVVERHPYSVEVRILGTATEMVPFSASPSTRLFLVSISNPKILEIMGDGVVESISFSADVNMAKTNPKE